MCDIIKIGESTAIVCGGHKDHECDEKATVYETHEGQRFTFNNDEEAKMFYEENYRKVGMCSVACSICGSAAFDNAWRLDF